MVNLSHHERHNANPLFVPTLQNGNAYREAACGVEVINDV